MPAKININSRKQFFAVCVVLIVITLAVFWQVSRYGFINLDDPVYVTENRNIQQGITLEGIGWAFATRYAHLWHPLTWISFMLDYQLYGLNAGGYHVTNVILHILSVLLLFWLFNRMTHAFWRSAFVAALFALHPLHVESVAWITERKDVLSVFFWMVTLCLYVRYTEEPAVERYLLVLASFICALLSKPMVVTLPLIMLLVDYWPLGRFDSTMAGSGTKEIIFSSAANQATAKPGFKKEKKQNKVKEENVKNDCPADKQRLSGNINERSVGARNLLWEKIPFFILSVIITIVTIYNPGQRLAKNFPLAIRLANAPVSFVTYLEKTFWPNNLAVFYPFPGQIPIWQIVGSCIIILLISVPVISKMKRVPCLLVGWLWYAITIIPVIKIIQVGNDAMADRYHYLPSIGIAVMIAWGIGLLFPRGEIYRKILFTAGMAVFIIMAALTWKQCQYWRGDVELFSHALHVTKDNWLAHYNLAVALAAAGEKKEVFYHYNEAIRIIPEYANSYNNRGNAYAKIGQYELAFEDYAKAIDLKPDYYDAYFNRGTVFATLGHFQSAIADFNEAIRLKHDYAEAYNNLGAVYLDQDNNEAGCYNAQKACLLGNCRALQWARGKGFCR